jgi:hypothetical protein
MKMGMGLPQSGHSVYRQPTSWSLGLVAVKGQAAGSAEGDDHQDESHGRGEQEAKVPFREAQKMNQLKKSIWPHVHL